MRFSLLCLSATLGVIAGSAVCAAHAQTAEPPGRDEALPEKLTLQEKLESLAEGFDGRVGIYVRHLRSGQRAAVNADSLFPTASLIKVPILLTTFARIEDGALAYDQALTFRDSLRYDAPEDLLVKFRDGAEISLSEVAMLMLTMSDNTAALWLQQLVGEATARQQRPEAAGERRTAERRYWRRWGRGGAAVNEWLVAHGFEKTRSNSGVPERREAYERYGWGQTTPREMARMLVMIRRGEAVSPSAGAEMYRALTRSFWDDAALSQIPPTVQAASKQGWVSTSRSEVVLVNAPHGDYVFCVVTAEQQDTSPRPENEGDRLIRAVSRLLWRHFEPASDWHPPEGAAAYR